MYIVLNRKDKKREGMNELYSKEIIIEILEKA